MGHVDWNAFVRGQLTNLGTLLLVNSLVAIAINAISDHGNFLGALVMSQCIGLSCELIGKLTYFGLQGFGAARAYPWAFLAALGGLPLGAWLAFQLSGQGQTGSLDATLATSSRYVWLTALICFFFYALKTISVRKQELDEFRHAASLRELASQKAALHARLQVLQAQIEPHFLFNTLANLHSLIGRDDEAARSLLERLNNYLRATLAHSRAEHATLGRECEVLRAYLAIHAQRMGPRLSWRVDLPASLENIPFPPMLLQPLVENAIIHGIEPKIDGGHVSLVIGVEDGSLDCIISDDGVGVSDCGGGWRDGAGKRAGASFQPL